MPNPVNAISDTVLVLIGNAIRPHDAELFFGTVLSTDTLLYFPAYVSMPQILVEGHFFKSKSEARRNGWGNEVPEGLSFFKIGGKTKGRELHILKMTTVIREFETSVSTLELLELCVCEANELSLLEKDWLRSICI